MKPEKTEYKEIYRMSMCCGAPEHGDAEGFCAACGEATGFEYYDEDGNECDEDGNSL